jgi:ATP synthase protein I
MALILHLCFCLSASGHYFKRFGMFKIVLLQISAVLTLALLLAAWLGVNAALSLTLGGLACIVPNALFALRLAIQARRPGGANVVSFFTGEFVKLALTVAMLLVIAMKYHELNWLALLVGFIVALKSYLLSFLFNKN